MSQILFNELEYAPDSQEQKLVDNNGKPDIPAILRQHKCKVYDVPTILYDKRWLGTDEIQVELFTSSIEKSKALGALLKSKLSGVDAEVTATANSLRIHDIVVRSGNVEAEPLLELTDLCMWAEPNKLNKMPENERTARFSDLKKAEPYLARDVAICSRSQKFLLRVIKKFNAGTGAAKNKKSVEKAKDLFSRLEKRRSKLSEIIREQESLMGEVHVCAACDHVLLISAKKRALAGESREVLEEKLRSLEQKLAELSGPENKTKRKKVQRKVSLFRSSLDALSGQNPASSSTRSPTP